MVLEKLTLWAVRAVSQGGAQQGALLVTCVLHVAAPDAVGDAPRAQASVNGVH